MKNDTRIYLFLENHPKHFVSHPQEVKTQRKIISFEVTANPSKMTSKSQLLLISTRSRSRSRSRSYILTLVIEGVGP
jgi:hypothetical protein